MLKICWRSRNIKKYALILRYAASSYSEVNQTVATKPWRSRLSKNEGYIPMIESYCITDILNHIDTDIKPEDHLIVFDIDNTIVESIDQLASTQWFDAMIKFKMEQEQLTHIEALERTLPLNFLLIQHTMIQPIQLSTTVELIRKLQGNRHKVIALTARSPEPLKACTIEHLNKVNIDFTHTSIYPHDIIFHQRLHYSNGIIFAGGSPHKGNVLSTMLNTVGYTPKKIIFIDDKEYNHYAIKETFKQINLDPICLWYRYCSVKETQFDLTFTQGRLLSLCEQHPEIDATYQAWLKSAKE